MTEQEIDEIIEIVLQAIRTSSKTIVQLPAVTTVGDTDSIELSGGKRITFATLASLIEDRIPSVEIVQTSGSSISVVMSQKAVTDLLNGKADKDTTYTKSDVNTLLGNKQDTLVSGGNIKTVNGQSLVGGGNIDIQSGGDGENIFNRSLRPEKMGFIKVVSDNLFDQDNCTHGYRINRTTHSIVTADSLTKISDYMLIEEGASYYCPLSGNYYDYCWYDKDYQTKNEWYGNLQGGTVPLVAPEGAKYLRITSRDNYDNVVRVVKGSAKPFDAFKQQIDENLLPPGSGGGPEVVQTTGQSTTAVMSQKAVTDAIAGAGGGKVVTAMDVLGEKTMAKKNVASLAANTLSELTNFPWYIKTGLAFSASAKFTSFTSISVGQGIDAAKLGMWVTVNATQFSINNKDVNGNPINPTTGTHGMTIANDIDVAVSVNDSLDLTLVISSNGLTKMFRYNRQSWGAYIRGGHAGTIGVKSETALTDVVITAGCDKLNKAVWVFGDSYLDMQSTRWPWYAWKNGCYDWLHVGLAGGQSAELYADLLRCAALARPQYIVWCLGMNDTDADWATTYDTLKTLCTNRGITLICATIPNTPIKDKTTINATVKASGYRYIDFAHAVGADEYPSSWYSGMLSKDDVHPTATGAEALAKQAMLDFALLSGTEHKTINGESILGAGNLEIGPEVVQTTGTATDKVMSQKAVSDLIGDLETLLSAI